MLNCTHIVAISNVRKMIAVNVLKESYRSNSYYLWLTISSRDTGYCDLKFLKKERLHFCFTSVLLFEKEKVCFKCLKVYACT